MEPHTLGVMYRAACRACGSVGKTAELIRALAYQTLAEGFVGMAAFKGRQEPVSFVCAFCVSFRVGVSWFCFFVN